MQNMQSSLQITDQAWFALYQNSSQNVSIAITQQTKENPKFYQTFHLSAMTIYYQ